jgi:transposase
MDAVYGNEKRGQPPYDPQMMTKVLVYGYCVGVLSSRRIERRLVEDIAFRVLGAGNQPNFRTISDFRQIHLKTLEGLFEQVLKIALEAGAMKVGRVAVDGTKVKANASKHIRWRMLTRTADLADLIGRVREGKKDAENELRNLLYAGARNRIGG